MFCFGNDSKYWYIHLVDVITSYGISIPEFCFVDNPHLRETNIIYAKWHRNYKDAQMQHLSTGIKSSAQLQVTGVGDVTPILVYWLCPLLKNLLWLGKVENQIKALFFYFNLWRPLKIEKEDTYPNIQNIASPANKFFLYITVSSIIFLPHWFLLYTSVFNFPMYMCCCRIMLRSA